DIQRDGSGPVPPSQRERGGAEGGDERLEARLVGRLHEEASEGEIVLHDEEGAVARLDVRAVVADLVHHYLRRLLVARLLALRRLRPGGRLHELPHHAADRGLRRIGLRQIEGEGAPAAGRADEMNLSPEEPGDLAADGQAQPGAAVLPARAAVRLLEGFEDDLLL